MKLALHWAVVVFPGSNCERDLIHSLGVLGYRVSPVWHRDLVPSDVDAVAIPGGFSFGDLPRTGVRASASRVLDSVREHAASGKPVLGICNGFQILVEAGLLPGALVRNRAGKFQCVGVHLRVARQFPGLDSGEVLAIPMAHGAGRFDASPGLLDELESNGQVAFRYCHADGAVAESANLNGSANSIAGISNRAGNILGMMPHPERACEAILGGTDGRRVFEAVAAGRV